MSASTHSPSPLQDRSSTPQTTSAEKRIHKEQPRIRRRNRLITSCLECRRRKLRCEKQKPCSNCTKFSRSCVFIALGLDPGSQAKLTEVKERMGMLERTLEDDVARRGKSCSPSNASLLNPPTFPGQGEPLSDREDDDDETRNLEASNIAIQDAAYYDDDGNDDFVDLGITMGKLRITEQMGGFVRPRFSEERKSYVNYLKAGNQIDLRNNHQKRVEKTTLMSYLPSRALADKLMGHYWQAVHVIARTVHRSSFECQYELLWNNINQDIQPRVSFQAIVLAALLSSVVSMSEEKVLNDFGVHKQSLVDDFRQGTESALSRANFLQTTKLETLQAFVMYLIPLCRAEVSRAHSALTGTCIRLAECMSLHRDPTTWSKNPIEIHVRRLVWYQICFLDLRTSEATGPRPQIRRDEYDTRFPLNVDDIELDCAHKRGEEVTEDKTYFTDMTITRMRFECYEMLCLLVLERSKLEKKGPQGERQTTLTFVLSSIQAFKAAMEKTYLPMFNKSIPMHVIAMEIYGILSNRMYLTILFKFASSDKQKMPERLRQILMSTALMLLEHSITIERQPALSPWSWCVGALHQYHSALLLLTEMYAGPCDAACKARIWKCMDFVFDLPPELPSNEKARMVFSELAGKTEAYANMRRVRAPANLPHAGPRTQLDSYKQRQAEESSRGTGSGTGGKRERSVSVHLGTRSGLTVNSNSPPVLSPQHHHFPPGYGPLGAIPQVDWPYFGIPTTSGSQIQHPPMTSVSEPYDFGGFSMTGPTSTTGGLLSAEIQSLSELESNSSGFGRQQQQQSGESGEGDNDSPMDALQNIDWVSTAAYYYRHPSPTFHQT